MRVPVEWLKDYVDIKDIDNDLLVERLIMTGSNSEGVEIISDGLSGVVVGHILKISPHPDADKLCLCQIDVGTEELQIVTGATNMKVGDYVPVALHGAVLSGGLKIKRGKLRGEASNGMLCSLEELGVSKSAIPKAFEDGILIFDQAYPLGADVIQLLKLNHPIIEFEITPNRPDCLSMVGMAREVCATFDKSLIIPETLIDQDTDSNSPINLIVDAPELCPRYLAKVVENVIIKPSPLWMQMRLISAGMRPVNNIVDITNYVMLELGQPIHAFDLDALGGKTIGVRRANDGETIKTLDDKERTLNDEMLVITDGTKPVAIAGVMGGAYTEVTKSTQNVLLEVAQFNKTSIRKTSKELGLRSEASSRFEKGVDEYLAPFAMARLCHLIESLGAGNVMPGISESYPSPRPVREISYTADFINNVIGSKMSQSEIEAILNKLNIRTIDGKAIIPEYRMDLEKPIDLVEEVARIYGYDRIEMTLPKMNSWGAYTNGQLIEERAKHELFCQGVDEILTYSFVSPKDLDKIRTSQESLARHQVMLINPLGEEYSAMRSTLMPNVLEVLSRNFNRKIKGARLFEMGSVFLPKEMPITQQPIEKKMLTIGLYGENEDFYTLKGIVESVLNGLGVEGYFFEKESNHPTFHKGRCANVLWRGHVVATLGELHPLVLENYNVSSRAYLADLDFNLLMQIAKDSKRFKAIPKFPAIERDLALLVADDTTSYAIEQVIVDAAGDLLESVKLFDLYKGPQIPDGQKSLAYALLFRKADRTLTDEEINPIFDQILKDLSLKLNAQLR